MIAKYGSNNGFGWNLHEVVAAQIVSVPTDVPVRIAGKAYGTSDGYVNSNLRGYSRRHQRGALLPRHCSCTQAFWVANMVSLGKLEVAESRCTVKMRLRN